MKSKVIVMLILCLALLSSCSSDTSSEINNENLELKAEIESLRAENESLKQEIVETETTTISETVKVSDETESLTTIQNMTAEEVTSIISISRAKIAKVNSVGGADVVLNWRNNSDKSIKYITFNISVYNAVSDIITDEISGKSQFKCRLTGPIEPITEKIENAKTNFIESMYLYYNNDSILLDDNLGLCYCGIDIDPNTGVRTRFAIPESEYDKLTIKTEFETVLYNSTARYVEINAIDIEYMDGSDVTLNSNEVSLAYIN